MNRHGLHVAFGDLRLTLFPCGGVRVEAPGALAFPDGDAPPEEYPSLGAFLAARGQPANDTAPRPRRLPPEAEARLIDLPDGLRAWAREDARVRLCLAPHVRDGVPLPRCLANVARLLGDEGFPEVCRRLRDCDDPLLRAWLALRSVAPGTWP